MKSLFSKNTNRVTASIKTQILPKKKYTFSPFIMNLRIKTVFFLFFLNYYYFSLHKLFNHFKSSYHDKMM